LVGKIKKTGYKMNNKPLVSVLVTPYNQEDYIGMALDSLLLQDCQFDYEILISEDCSTDRTRDICIDYQKKYPEKIRLFLNEVNKGFINNYFGLIEHVNSKYIADCGADDYWISPDKLRKQVEILENHPEVSLVYGNWQKFNQKNGIFETDIAEISEDRFDRNCFGHKALKDYINNQKVKRVVLSTACFRTDWLKDSIVSHRELFYGKYVVCEDLPITLCLLKNGPFYMMKEELMVYRVLETSMSHNKEKNEYLKGFAWSAFLQTLNLAEGLGLSTPEIEPYIKNILPDFILQAFLMKDKKWMGIIQKEIKNHDIHCGTKQKFLFFCVKHRHVYGFIFFIYKYLKRH
jgi:glycosyltransferase involved in cell wall biosynthesis